MMYNEGQVWRDVHLKKVKRSQVLPGEQRRKWAAAHFRVAPCCALGLRYAKYQDAIAQGWPWWFSWTVMIIMAVIIWARISHDVAMFRSWQNCSSMEDKLQFHEEERVSEMPWHTNMHHDSLAAFPREIMSAGNRVPSRCFVKSTQFLQFPFRCRDSRSHRWWRRFPHQQGDSETLWARPRWEDDSRPWCTWCTLMSCL